MASAARLVGLVQSPDPPEEKYRSSPNSLTGDSSPSSGQVSNYPKTGMQWYVAFRGIQPALEKKNEYAQYHLAKSEVGELLADWTRAEWVPKRRARGTPHTIENYHPTSMERKVVSAPLRAFLAQAQTRPRRILYYGMGKHEVGLAALGARGTAFGYDSHHPEPSRRQLPGGLFDEIHCHYVLNIVDSIEGKTILTEIYPILTSDGVVIISVRRDL